MSGFNVWHYLVDLFQWLKPYPRSCWDWCQSWMHPKLSTQAIKELARAWNILLLALIPPKPSFLPRVMISNLVSNRRLLLGKKSFNDVTARRNRWPTLCHKDAIKIESTSRLQALSTKTSTFAPRKGQKEVFGKRKTIVAETDSPFHCELYKVCLFGGGTPWPDHLIELITTISE